MRRRAVIAFGGNALVTEEDEATEALQARRAEAAARLLADVVRGGLDIIVVHGNGPQVGNILIQMEEAALKVPPSPLDTCVAMSQGSMGYIIDRGLRNQFARRGVDRQVVTLVTEVLVDADDPAFERPTKPVGPFFTRYRARVLKRRNRWQMVEDAGRGWRKVVASPRPREVLNAGVVLDLMDRGHVVIAAGGGGIPVTRRAGRLHGVEAVIDKDHTAALIAGAVKAESLVVLTGVSHVFLGFGKPGARPLKAVGASAMARHLEAGEFAEGSMRPKIEACLEFLAAGGKQAIITEAPLLKAALRGKAGTRIHPDEFK